MPNPTGYDLAGRVAAMSDDQNAELYWLKAIESLKGAESELSNGRYNNATNRAYYAVFQAAISALLNDGVRPRDGRWAHTFVQAEFVGRLINRRRRFPPALRDTLSLLQRFRHNADYRGATIDRAEARTAVRRSREFLNAVRPGVEL
jgi:uncharacterized protein (UPF0332 family)